MLIRKSGISRILCAFETQKRNPSAAEKLIADGERAILDRLYAPTSFAPVPTTKNREHPYYRIAVGNFVVLYCVIGQVVDVRRFVSRGGAQTVVVISLQTYETAKTPKKRTLFEALRSCPFGGIDIGECVLRGRTPSVCDSMIAATALQNDLILVTRNVADFQFDGLRVINPFE